MAPPHGSLPENFAPTRDHDMDKVYSNFGPLTTYTDSQQASQFLDMFRDMARMKQAQASPAAQGASQAAGDRLSQQAKGWIASGKTHLISIGGEHYDALEPTEQLKVINYFLGRLTGSDILSNKEDALRWAFRSMPHILGGSSGGRAVNKAVILLREEAGRLGGAASSGSASAQGGGMAGAGAPADGSDETSGLGSTGLAQAIMYASQILFQAGLLKKPDISTINNDPYGAGMRTIMGAISAGMASRRPAQREAAEMAKNLIDSSGGQAAQAVQTPGASTGGAGAPAGASAGTGGAAAGGGGAAGTGAAGGILSLVSQGIGAVIKFLMGLPNTPKVDPNVLVEMALSTEQKYWFPSGQVAENGFYGPYMASDGKYWAEVDYDASSGQFVFSGRYTVIPNEAVQAVQQAAAQGG